MRSWLHTILNEPIAPPLVLVTVLRTAGSTPREAGAQMLVTRHRTWGSIGGGRLEFDEIAAARALMGEAQQGFWHRAARRTILGPDAGQCCGGSAEVLHECIGALELAVLQALSTVAALARPVCGGAPIVAHATTDAFMVSGLTSEAIVIEPVVRRARRVVIYGGGHVAAALGHALAPLPFGVTTVIDNAAAAMAVVADGASGVVRSSDLVTAARDAPAAAIHLVMTHSHDLDYAICDALLRRDDTAFVGLIGSATKRARFVQRLARTGHTGSSLARLVCPIGIEGVAGKAPAVIAVAVAAQLLARFPPP